MRYKSFYEESRVLGIRCNVFNCETHLRYCRTSVGSSETVASGVNVISKVSRLNAVIHSFCLHAFIYTLILSASKHTGQSTMKLLLNDLNERFSVRLSTSPPHSHLFNREQVRSQNICTPFLCISTLRAECHEMLNYESSLLMEFFVYLSSA